MRDLELYLEHFDADVSVEVVDYYYQAPVTTQFALAETPEDIYGNEEFDYIVYCNGIDVTDQLDQYDLGDIDSAISEHARQERDDPGI